MYKGTTYFNDKNFEQRKEKIKFKTDPLIPNFGLFRIMEEDHTIGNAIHNKLLESRCVIFCAYKKPHPLENFIILKIVTNELLTPVQALDSCLKDLYIELSILEEDFNKSIKNKK
jgi:DNA-directed RNA polymerase II subunit RPB11